MVPDPPSGDAFATGFPDVEKRLVEITQSLLTDMRETERLSRKQVQKFKKATIEQLDNQPKTGLHEFIVPVFVDKSGVLNLVVPSSFKKSRSLNLWMLCRATPFGGVAEIFVAVGSEKKKVAVIGAAEPALEALQSGRIRCIFARKGQIDGAAEFACQTSKGFKAINDLVDATIDLHKSVLNKNGFSAPRLARAYIVSQHVFPKMFTSREWLQASWISYIDEAVGAFMGGFYRDQIRLIANARGESALKDNFPTISAIADQISNLEETGSLAGLEILTQPERISGVLFEATQFISKEDLRERLGTTVQEAISACLTLVMHFAVLVPELTNWGLAYPTYDNGERQMVSIQIDHAAIEKRYGIDVLKNFWNETPESLPIDATRYLHGDDVRFIPVDDVWEIDSDLDSEDMEEQARFLLQEAVASKKWVMPPGAWLEVKFGPFIGAQVYEVGPEVYFVWRREDWRYFESSVGTKTLGYGCELPPEPILKGSEQIQAACFLVMAAIVRDFWVLEERHSIFSVGKARAPRELRNRPERTIIYLPRVRYVTKKISLGRASESLEHVTRARHFVRPFFRRANPTPQQLAIARRERISPPDGHTYVRGHYRGGGKNQAIYRSRSAIRLLYEIEEAAVEETSFGRSQDWFVFERDVARLLE